MTDLLTLEPKSPMEKAAQLVQLETLKRQITERIDQYRADLLAITKELDVFSLKTGSYTISRVVKKLPRVEDFELLKASLEAADIPYNTKEVFADFMTVIFSRVVKEGRHLDGLGILESEYIMVRIATPKEEVDENAET